MRPIFCLPVLLFATGFVLLPVFVRSQPPGAGSLSHDGVLGQAYELNRGNVFGSGSKSHAWYSPGWMTGQIMLNSGDSIPEKGNIIYLNFDLASHKLYYRSYDSSVELRSSLIANFRLTDSLGDHAFVRVPAIDKNDFVEEVIVGESGYSLYRRKAAHNSPGDAYVRKDQAGEVDDSEYFLLYPDKRKVFWFHLSRWGLRKKLSFISPAAGKFMEEHPGVITRQMVIRFCDVVNESLTPR